MEHEGQRHVFWRSEGDAWFERNRAALEVWSPETDPPMRMVRQHGLRPKCVIEIGAANGYRVAALQSAYGCEAVAVDASLAAVEDGLRRYPGVYFVHRMAHNIILTGVPQSLWVFDLAIVHFVLHWVAREHLTQSIAQIDARIRDGGYLLLGDFAPAAGRWRIPYHHKPGVWTYKQDYAQAFLATGLYSVVATQMYAHDGQLDPGASEGNRAAVTLLRKSLIDHYTEGAHGR